jgi:serine/threonine protein kinase
MIRNGISHIHSLGFAHNDINPSNIMFDDNNTLVIIDFDLCLPFESILTTTKQTPGWHDPEVQTSDPRNDWDVVLEI